MNRNKERNLKYVIRPIECIVKVNSQVNVLKNKYYLINRLIKLKIQCYFLNNKQK